MLNHRDNLQIKGPDYTVGDLKTIDDCDHAIADLAEIIADIEGRLASPTNLDPEWRRRASRALSLKNAARSEVYSHRKDMKMSDWKRWETTFVAVVKRIDPNVFATAVVATNSLEGIPPMEKAA